MKKDSRDAIIDYDPPTMEPLYGEELDSDYEKNSTVAAGVMLMVLVLLGCLVYFFNMI